MKAGWRVVALGEVCDVLDSKRKPITKRDRQPGPFPYFGATGELDRVAGYIFNEPLVLLGEDGAKWGAGDNSAFRVAGKVWVNNHAHVIRPIREQLDDDWLVYYLNFSDLAEFITGLTVPKLNQGRMREIPIPLPPLDEQKRIAAVLDEAFEGLSRARTNAEANLADARELSSRHAAALFDRVAMEAKSTRRVAEIAAPEKGSIRTGPFGSQLLHSEFVESGVAVLGIDNAVKNEFQWAKRRFITEEKYKELSRYTVRPGDVIITIMGTCGRCAVVPDDIPKAINTKHLCCITLDQRLCNPDFLHAYFLHSPVARDYLDSQVLGSIMDGLNMGIIKEMPVTLPTLEVQKDVVSAISEMRGSSLALSAFYSDNIAELDTLRQSLLQKAFSGELT